MICTKKHIGLLSLLLVACTGLGGEEQIKISQKIEVLNYTFELFEARDELPYLQALADSDSMSDAYWLWEGIDKRMKQKASYTREDVETSIENCKRDEVKCYFDNELMQLKRALDMAVKAFETEDIDESNQLAILSNEIGLEVLFSLYKDEEDEFAIPEKDLDKILNRYFVELVKDLVEYKKVCDSISSDLRITARYQGHCGTGLMEAIQALSSQVNDVIPPEDSLDIFMIEQICQFEAKELGTYSKDLDVSEKCPYTTNKVINISLQHDLYLAE